MDLHSPKIIKHLCKKYKIKPSRRRGQNFLVSKNVLEKIVKTANLKNDDVVLEIGAGMGVLTEKLAQNVKEVLSVEIDSTFTKVLSETIGQYKNIKILKEDVLSKEFYNYFIKWLEKVSPNGHYKIVSNLPYNITSVVLRYFLEIKERPAEMILMVQKEVAQRIVAKPGKMSKLAVSVQFYSQPEIISNVSKNNFWPKPEVDSAVIKLEVGKGYQELAEKEKIKSKDFFKIIKIGFSSKRKQLQNNLAVGLKKDKEETKDILKKVGIDEKIRAQDLSMENWIALVSSLINI